MDIMEKNLKLRCRTTNVCHDAADLERQIAGAAEAAGAADARLGLGLFAETSLKAQSRLVMAGVVAGARSLIEIIIGAGLTGSPLAPAVYKAMELGLDRMPWKDGPGTAVRGVNAAVKAAEALRAAARAVDDALNREEVSDDV
jgi:hypothetical protein